MAGPLQQLVRREVLLGAEHRLDDGPALARQAQVLVGEEIQESLPGGRVGGICHKASLGGAATASQKGTFRPKPLRAVVLPGCPPEAQPSRTLLRFRLRGDDRLVNTKATCREKRWI